MLKLNLQNNNNNCILCVCMGGGRGFNSASLAWKTYEATSPPGGQTIYIDHDLLRSSDAMTSWKNDKSEWSHRITDVLLVHRLFQMTGTHRSQQDSDVIVIESVRTSNCSVLGGVGRQRWSEALDLTSRFVFTCRGHIRRDTSQNWN